MPSLWVARHSPHPPRAGCLQEGRWRLYLGIWPLGLTLAGGCPYSECVIYTLSLALFFLTHPHSNTDAHSHLHPFKDTLFNLWGDFEGLRIPSWATGQGSHPPKWPWVLGTGSLSASPGRRNRPSSQESLHLCLH